MQKETERRGKPSMIKLGAITKLVITTQQQGIFFWYELHKILKVSGLLRDPLGPAIGLHHIVVVVPHCVAIRIYRKIGKTTE